MIKRNINSIRILVNILLNKTRKPAANFIKYFLILITMMCALGFEPVKGGKMNVIFGSEGITHLTLSDNPDTDYIWSEKNKNWGNLIIRYRTSDSHWYEYITENSSNRRSTASGNDWYEISYDIGDQSNPDLIIKERFSLNDDTLTWTIVLLNNSNKQQIIGDLAFNNFFHIIERNSWQTRLYLHPFIAGHGSYLYWERPNGQGPFLVMIPVSGTKLEYFERPNIEGWKWDGNYSFYIHSGCNGANETRGTWRQEHTSVTLEPKGQSGDTVSYGFKFQAADDHDDIRNVVYDNDGFDVRVVPGMTVPTDLKAMFSLRTKKDFTITAEYPSETVITYHGKEQPDIHVYEVRFSKLGENLLTVNYDGDKYMPLEFFATEPLETLIKKRADFLTTKHQVRDKTKWYDGLFGGWDLENKKLCTPDSYAGLQYYMVGGSSEETYCAGIYLGGKNRAYPDSSQIEAIEYYLENFVWGGLQRTSTESPHVYGVYHTENWYDNRNSDHGLGSGGQGQEKMWRWADYTVLSMLYYEMYKIAKNYPEMVNYLGADGYLDRAFGTLKAFFKVLYNIRMTTPPWSFQGWCDWAYVGTPFHERYTLKIIDALENEGRRADAAWLKKEFDKKARLFIWDIGLLGDTEGFPFSNCIWEATHVIAKYAKENPISPKLYYYFDKNKGIWYSRPETPMADVDAYMAYQIGGNLAQRDWLAPSYYMLGSDINCMNVHLDKLWYMTQMGGWSILDYGLYYSDEPWKYINLGYNSFMGPWALLNTGTRESNYGYWHPGLENDGSATWAFSPTKYAPAWTNAHHPIARGVGKFSGDQDNGLSAALDMAATIVVNDPLFGLIAYGGDVKKVANGIEAICKDGIRQRFHWIDTMNDKNTRFHLELDRDGFSKTIFIRDNLHAIEFELENRTANSHKTTMEIAGLPAGTYRVTVNGKKQCEFRCSVGERIEFSASVPNKAISNIAINYISSTTPDSTIPPPPSHIPTGGNFIDEFNDQVDEGWTVLDGSWLVDDGKYCCTLFSGNYKTIVEDKRYSDFTCQVDLLTLGNHGDAGLIFRVQDGPGLDSNFKGYYAGISASRDTIQLGYFDGSEYHELTSAVMAIDDGIWYSLKVEAIGSNIKVFLNNTLKISYNCSHYSSGMIGLRTYYAAAIFDNVFIYL